MGVLEFSSLFFSPVFTATYVFQEEKKEQRGSGSCAIFSEDSLVKWVSGENFSPFTGALKVYF